VFVCSVLLCCFPSFTAETSAVEAFDARDAREAGEAGEARILVSDSAFLSCQCQKQVPVCNALERFIREHHEVSPSRYVRDFLDSLGYFNARWDTLPGRRFAVQTGKGSTIASEKISGAAAGIVDSISPFLCPRKYDAGEIRERVAEIGRRLAEKGYPFATIAVSISPFGDSGVHAPSLPADTLRVAYGVRTDRKCFFAEPRLIGARETRQGLLLLDVQVKKGGLFDSRKIEATLEALGRRTYIEHIDVGKIAALPAELREKNDSAASQDVEYVSVPFYMKDRTGLGIEGALGFNSQQGGETFLQGDLTLSFLNLFHSGESASFLYAGDKTYQKFHVDASKPWFLGRPMTCSASFGLEVHESSYGYLSGEASVLDEIQNNWNAGFSIKGSETTMDSTGRSWRYFGAEFLLSTFREQLREGVFSSELSLAAGGGIAGRERNYTRSHVEFTGGIHAPFWRHQAVHLRIVSEDLISDELNLVDAEMYRVGGYRSVRGYMENEPGFAFRTVAYDQLEYLYYFSPRGSAYIFCDNGFGFAQSLTRVKWGDRINFLGYGLGIRLPAKVGTLTLEWARNKDDLKSWGRVNVQVSNNNMAE
jgi:outer membrane protein assembly factor BamA